MIAKENKFNPVLDYFNGLKWDGKSRVSNWLSAYLGAPDTEYSRLVGKRLLLAVLARAFQPGCKSDDMVVLEGEQGKFKSQAVEALLPNPKWFSDENFDPREKDARVGLRGKLIYEMAEIQSLSKSDVDLMKAFLSRKVDKYRPPYGRTEEEFPRTVTFIGTTNKDYYLRDATGGRRFLPVKIGDINLAAIRADRDQLWAEAMNMRAAGEKWWFEGSEKEIAETEQSDRYDEDIWTQAVLAWCDNPESTQREFNGDGSNDPIEILSDSSKVLLDEVLLHALRKPLAQQNQSDKMRLAGILKRAGWKRRQMGPRNRQSWFYVRPEGQEPPPPEPVNQGILPLTEPFFPPDQEKEP
jgi:predicted P-loop ATPase